MRIVTKNGVRFNVDNNIVIGDNFDKAMFIFEKDELKEVNLNGYCIKKIKGSTPINCFSNKSQIVIDEYIDQVKITKDGLIIQRELDEDIVISRQTILEILR